MKTQSADRHSMSAFLTCLMQLIISPRKGWEDIALRDQPSSTLASAGLYPLLGVTACTAFIHRFYDSALTLVMLVQDAIITFVQFFVTYFVASFFFAIFLRRITVNAGDDETPDEHHKRENRYNTFIIYNVALLALIAIINNCLPMELSIVQFLPMFAIIVMWTGMSFLNVIESKSLSFVVLCVSAILLPPYIIGYLFRLILPS